MDKRFQLLIFFVFIIGALVGGRLFWLQIVKSQVRDFNFAPETIIAERGKILAQEEDDLLPLAVNFKQYHLIADPEIIKEEDLVNEIAEKLAPFLEIKVPAENFFVEEDEAAEKFKSLLSRLSRSQSRYQLLRKDLSSSEYEAIKELALPGIFFQAFPKRYYPEGKLFSHLTGFTREVESRLQGQYGLEDFFEEELRGVNGYQVRDSFSLPVYRTLQRDEPGADLVLTVDRVLQFHSFKLLEEAVKKYRADSGTIILLDPSTGKILAMVNYPAFDPNQYSQVENMSLFKNSAISESFEPGSIFKVITMASALDAEAIKKESTFQDTGFVEIDGETIRNVDEENFGLASMTKILEKSINTGAVHVAGLLGKENFRNYLKKFGFGSLTDIELKGEASGNIDNLNQKQDIYLATASFGQGIAVTPLQMIVAVGSIANSGKLMKPYLVKEIRKGEQVIEREPKVVRSVISPQTAFTLSSMMSTVVEKEYKKRIKIPGYTIAGKTGTAQVPGPEGGYADQVIHSFVGFAPATDPQIVALVKLNNPREEKFAFYTVSEVFSELVEFVLKYYNVPPDKI
ncbi:penicillin-binding protein 2 [Patescibacteria group bacterium]|nr:penicillin-binding protein 2 [Patescibacteria group bacterium]